MAPWMPPNAGNRVVCRCEATCDGSCVPSNATIDWQPRGSVVLGPHEPRRDPSWRERLVAGGIYVRRGGQILDRKALQRPRSLAR